MCFGNRCNNRSVLRHDLEPISVGGHTFRHSFATILKSHGEDVKAVQELLRHANRSVTLNLHAQAATDIRRGAQSKVARLVFQSKEGQAEK
ncbi:MAG: tyrosine-type recombinase/integrase [Acidobacteria bacterium]|nr:tyrosine-type recombinase/integrase [Acidobacteriota bacterium]